MKILTQEQIEEFRQLWKEEFKEEISYDYAEIRLGELTLLYEYLLNRHLDQLYPPISANDSDPQEDQAQSA